MIDNISATYKELIDELIKINNRLYEKRIKRGGWVDNYNPSAYRGKGSTQKSTNHYGDPIDLDTMQHGGTSRSKKPNRYRKGPRDNNEREKRRRENLCYNCGKSGHRVREYKTQL